MMRNQVGVDVHTEGSLHTVTLDVPDKMAGLALQIPTGRVLKRRDPAQLAATTGDEYVVLEEAQGQVKLVFESIPLTANTEAGRLRATASSPSI